MKAEVASDAQERLHYWRCLYFAMGAPFPKIAPSMGIWAPSNAYDSLGLSEPTTQTAYRWVEPVLHG